MAVFGFALIFFTPSGVSLRYSTSLWRYSALPNLLHTRHGIVVVFDFAVAVFGFALIFFTSGGVSLWYSTSLWWYSASP